MKISKKIISIFTAAVFVASCNLYGNINKTATAADKVYTADGGFSAAAGYKSSFRVSCRLPQVGVGCSNRGALRRRMSATRIQLSRESVVADSQFGFDGNNGLWLEQKRGYKVQKRA